VAQGYGFGASITQSGLFLLPFAVAMVLVAPITGRIAIAIGSKDGAGGRLVFAASSYLLLVLAHSQAWNIYAAPACSASGSPWATPAWPTSSSKPCPPARPAWPRG
jgi:hypothetical protein